MGREYEGWGAGERLRRLHRAFRDIAVERDRLGLPNRQLSGRELGKQAGFLASVMKYQRGRASHQEGMHAWAELRSMDAAWNEQQAAERLVETAAIERRTDDAEYKLRCDLVRQSMYLQKLGR